MAKSKYINTALAIIVLMEGLTTSVAGQDIAAKLKQSLRLMPSEEQWIDYNGDGAQLGIKQAYIYGDPAKPGLYVIRIKFPKGVMSLPHSHPETRIGTVIKGTWWTGTEESFEPTKTTPIPVGGMMVHQAGEVHYDGSINEEVIVQITGIGPSGKTPVRTGQPGFSIVP
jgi:quercetin dioxygenase-like cupin family protein